MQPDLNRGRWSPATRKLYDLFWRSFAGFCAERLVEPLPASAETIADFLIAKAETHSTSWLSGARAAIIQIHALYGHVVNVKGSCIRDTWAEIRRQKGTAHTPKAALDDNAIRRIVAGIPSDRLLDRAVVLVGFASLMRRSEIAALDVDDLAFSDTALIISIKRSKTDKAGKGAQVAVRRHPTEFCPVAALERWFESAGINGGAVFRNRRGDRIVPRKVADIAKRWAANAGFDPKVIGAHSFRRGGITTMFRNGAKIEDIMRVSRHVTPSIALGYIEAQQAELNPATAALGL